MNLRGRAADCEGTSFFAVVHVPSSCIVYSAHLAFRAIDADRHAHYERDSDKG